jgi:signal transduction histidine kinase
MIRSLRGKLILSHFSVIFIAMTVATLLLLTLSQGYFLEALEQSLVAQANVIAETLIPGAEVSTLSQSISPAYNAVQQQRIGNLSVQVENKESTADPALTPSLSGSNLAYLNAFSVELSAALETRLRVLDNQGIVLVDSAGLDEGKDLNEVDVIALALQGAQRSHSEKIGGEDWLSVAVPVWIDDQIAGVIYLSQPLRDVAAVLGDLRLRLLLVLLIALPLSALMGLFLARHIARPVRTLTIATSKLSGGDYDYPLDTSGRDELGQLSQSFASMRDRLRAVERMRAQFVSDVSHELRTPLTAIKGLAETLRGGAADDPSVRDRFLASVEDETDRLIRLVNDLLVLSRADSQALRLRREEFDLAHMAQAITERLTTQAETLNLSLRLCLEASPIRVIGDPDRVEQVLVILLDNAMKHSPPGETVWIEGSTVKIEKGDEDARAGSSVHMHLPLPAGEWALLSITDSGEGIPAKDLPHVFDRFYRADTSRSRDRGGSGLGLSIAQAVIEAHGGYIWLESPSNSPRVAEGKTGTTSSFALPFPSPLSSR